MDPRTSDWAAPKQLRSLRTRAFAVGAVATVVSAIGLFTDHGRFFDSYITSWIFVLSAPIGMLGLLLINHVTRGTWGVIARRVFEAGARSLPVMALLFIPVLIGMREIYTWADPEIVANDALIQEKTPWLNVPFFIGRAVVYFVAWIALAFSISRLSRQQDDNADPALAQRMTSIAAGGLVLYGLTVTFAIFDWLMSLDPHWFSSIYGVYYFGGAALTAFCLLVLLMVWMSRFEPFNEVLRPAHFHDWGKLMLAFTMLWAYFAVSQLIITWSGNLPEEVPWYMARTTGMWKIFPYLIIILHFFVPFVLLLSSDLKADRRRLAGVAAFILVMRFIDIYYQAGPSLHFESWHWLDFALPVAIGGLWLGSFASLLADRPILPRNDPFFDEAVHHNG
ncbi:hypothetical protein DRQ53_07090 [bacterium]|nr:MAG: hypothetical protein DRQ53_07090 [bacterium]